MGNSAALRRPLEKKPIPNPKGKFDASLIMYFISPTHTNIQIYKAKKVHNHDDKNERENCRQRLI